jgi:hypothetical protein
MIINPRVPFLSVLSKINFSNKKPKVVMMKLPGKTKANVSPLIFQNK